jgi:hypothetical protein
VISGTSRYWASPKLSIAPVLCGKVSYVQIKERCEFLHKKTDNTSRKYYDPLLGHPPGRGPG